MNPVNDPPVWLITGCSSGLGRALAARVLDRGHRLIATARRPESLAELVAVDPSRCRAFALDVADAPRVAPVVARAAAAFGRLDVVVNNAGYGLVGAVEEYDEAQITRNFETNFFGALRVIRAALPILRAQRHGKSKAAAPPGWRRIFRAWADRERHDETSAHQRTARRMPGKKLAGGGGAVMSLKLLNPREVVAAAEQVWDEVKFCSDACRMRKNGGARG